MTVTTSDIATSTALIATTIVDGTTIHYTSTVAPTTTAVNGTIHYTSTIVDGNGSYASTTTYGIVTTAAHHTYTSASNGPHYTINPSSPYSAYSAPSGPAYHQGSPAPEPYKPEPIQTHDVPVANPQVIPTPVQSELPSSEQNHGNSSTPYDNANPSAAKRLTTGFHFFILAFLFHLLK